MKLLINSILSLVALFLLISPANAKIEVLSSTKTALTVIYTPELEGMSDITIGGQNFSQPIFSDAGNVLTQIGYPQLLATKKTIAVPSPVGFKIKNIELGAIKQYSATMAPTYLLGRESSTTIDRQAYLNRPVDNWASVEYSGISRDKHIALLSIIAAKYNPAYHSIDVPEYVKVTITFDNSKVKDGKKVSKSKLSNQFLNNNVADSWTISDEQLYFQNDIEKVTKANKIQSEEVLSSGTWFKISIAETGVYELTADYLKSFGISIPNNELNTIKIFGNGGRELPQSVNFATLNHLNQQSIIVRKNGDGSLKSIIFFGAGTTGFEYVEKPSFFTGKKVLHYLNHFSKNNQYLLTWGGVDGNRSNPTPKLEGNIANQQQTYTRRDYYEEELVSAYHGGSGKQFFGRTYFSEPFERELINVADEGTITYKFSLGQSRASKYGGYFSVYDNNNLVANSLYIPASGDIETIRQLFVVSKPISELKNKSKSVIKLNYTNANHPTANGVFDFYELHYTSKNIANNGEIYLLTDPELSGLTEYKFSGFNGEVFAYDITDIGNPIQLQSYANNKFDLVTELTKNEPKRFYMASNLKKPLNMEKIAMKNLRNTKFDDDVIVITNSKLLESAKKFKEYRESTSNLKVGIFEVDDIYNEYNAGTMDITAIRDFVAQAMENWEVKPSYLVLWGDGHYDYRGLITKETNFVPPYESDDETAAMSDISSVSTDDFFARVVGNDLVIDIAVGRITVSSEEEGFKVVEKIKHYENNSDISNWRTKVTLVADDGFGGDDDGDGSMFVDDSEEFAHTRVPNFLEQKKIYMVEYPSQYTGAGIKKPAVNSELLRTINEDGSLLLNWYGHGNPQVWSHEAILDRDVSIRQMINYDRLFFLTAATCDFSKMDNFDSQSGAELMLLSEYGGAIGVYGASRIVYASGNHAINREVYKQLFTKNEDGSYPTLGEMNFRVKQTFYGTNDQKYYLLGDPTLRLLIPRYDVAFDSINGVAIDSTTNITLKGLQTVRLKGHIYFNNSSQVSTDFNGNIKLKLLDGNVQIDIKDVLNRNYHFEKFGGTLANGNYEVKDGVFEAEFILPKDISFSDENGQIFAYAYTEDDKFAKGNFDRVKIDGIATTDISDHEGPQIDINLDSRKFKAGDIVRNEPLLIVDLSDNSGINSTGIGVGHKIEAWIDNSEESIDMTSDYESSFEDYKKGSANKVLLGLAPGVHYVKVRAWDIYNNYSIAETYFNIKDPNAVVVGEVTALPTPFEESTKIVFKHNLNPPLDVELDVYDAKGAKVRTINTQILTPFEGTINWDGRDSYGSQVSIGSYYFRLKLDNIIANGTFLKGRTIKIK